MTLEVSGSGCIGLPGFGLGGIDLRRRSLRSTSNLLQSGGGPYIYAERNGKDWHIPTPLRFYTGPLRDQQLIRPSLIRDGIRSERST